MTQTVLVTGGAGYIGSHICVVLLEAGLDVVVVDNLSNGSTVAIERVQQISGKTLSFYQIDCCDKAKLSEVFAAHNIDAVIHLAGFKVVGESCQFPLRYYENNLNSTFALLEVMHTFEVKNFVFSSSANVYGNASQMPVTESYSRSVTNPYGRTKMMIEDILSDVVMAEPDKLKVALLRYFNPVGAHESGLIGEDPKSIPNNLMPYVTQVAIGKLASLSIYGNDYPTPDGTGVRDFIHVMDLAYGHLKAIEWLSHESSGPRCEAINLGTGQGYSVLEVVKTFEQVTGASVPYQIVGRREGDLAESYAEVSKAKHLLGWQAEKGLVEMVADAWRWQTQNPEGFSHD